MQEKELISLLSKKQNKSSKKKILKLLETGFTRNIWPILKESEKKRLLDILQEKRINDSLEIIDFLNKEKIDYVVLKGLTLWKFNKKRRFGDLDIFLKRKDLPKIRKMLMDKFGYKSQKRDFFEKFYLRIDNEISLYNPKKIYIELHFQIHTYSFKYAEDIGIDKENEIINIHNIPVKCLTKEMQLLEVIIHNVTHAFIADYNKWIIDINNIISNYNIDWNIFIKKTLKLNYQEEVFQAIYFLNKISNKSIKIPKKVKKILYDRSSKLRLNLTRKYILNPIINKKELIEKKQKNMFFFNFGLNLQLIKITYAIITKNIITYLYKIYLIICLLLFPPKIIIAERFRIKKKSPFIYLFYPINWLRVIFYRGLWARGIKKLF